MRQLLIRLFWVSVLPLLLLALYLAVGYVRILGHEGELTAEHHAKNAATLIDNFLAAQISGLQTLAGSPLLGDSSRLREFHASALGFREGFGAHVILVDVSMRMLLNTRAPFGVALPALPVPRNGGQGAGIVALATGLPAVGDIVDGPVAHQPLVAVAVPVLREGQAPRVLLSTMEIRQVAAQLEKVRLPAGWTLAVLDGSGDTIARHPDPGTALKPVALESAFSEVVPSSGARWKVAIEIDPEVRRAPIAAAIKALLAALAAALLISYLFGRFAGRSITGAVKSLADSGGEAPSQGVRIADVELIRERLEANAQSLHDSEVRYRELFAANPNPMWVYDLETLRFLAVNAAAVAHYGYSEAEFLAMTIADIRPPEDLPRLQENVAGRRAMEQAGFERAGNWRHLRKDGSVIDVEITAHTLDFRGRRAEAILALDITDRLRAEKRVEEYVLRLERATLGTAEAISRIMDQRDPYTAGHERRVGEISAAIAAEMGLSADAQRGLRVAGDLHDIGKISVPVEILVKPTRLSPMEFKLIQQHPESGHDILKGIDFPWPVAEVARQHHERIDGSGYPRGLKGGEIILEARILAVADVVEAMTSDRPYRPGLGLDKALAEIEAHAGTFYDADVAAACLRLFRERGYRILQ